jgi:hypothetical protein
MRIAALMLAACFSPCPAAADWGPLSRAQALERANSGQIGAFLFALRADARLWRTHNNANTAKDRRPGVGAGGRLQV